MPWSGQIGLPPNRRHTRQPLRVALDAVRERRVDERVGVVRAAAVDVQGLHDAPRVLDDREREDLRRQRLVHARDVEGKFAIQNIEGPGVLRVLCRERPVPVSYTHLTLPTKA